MQTQILRRKCDNPRCDTTEDFPMGNLKPSHEAALASWIVMTKEHTLRTGEAPQPLTKMACRAACAVEIIKDGLLEVPSQKIPAAN